MDEQVSNGAGEKPNISFKISKWTWAVIAFPFILAIVMILGYFERFGSCLSDTPVPNTSSEGLELSCLYSLSADQWGQAGDFLGGILNPFIGLATVILLVNSIRQNHIALQQNERALNDSTSELKNSNTIMENQKHLMDFDLKLRLFTDFTNKLINVLNQDLVYREAEEERRSSGEFVATCYSTYTVYEKYAGEQIAPPSMEYLSAVKSFELRMHYGFYLLKGIHDIYNSFPEKSEFRNTLELTSRTYIGEKFLHAIYVFINEELKDKENNHLSHKSINDFIVKSLRLSDDKYFIENSYL